MNYFALLVQYKFDTVSFHLTACVLVAKSVCKLVKAHCCVAQRSGYLPKMGANGIPIAHPCQVAMLDQRHASRGGAKLRGRSRYQYIAC